MMSNKDTARVLKAAKKVLNHNWVDLGNGRGFTKPASCFYPFQWNWDSAFIAYGYAHYDLTRAITELRTLFDGQWKNGMLPHILFHKTGMEDAEAYFPGPEIWGCKEASDLAPPGIQTSGITQPPLQTAAAWHIYKELHARNKEESIAFLEELYPKLLALHRYFHEQRDPEGWGLVTIYHPWESGFDNSPRWDAALERITSEDMSGYTRRDTGHVDAKYRPSDKDYGRYMAILLYLREHKYQIDKLKDNAPFRIKDVLLSSILYIADNRLLRMAERLGKETKEITGWMKRFENSLFKKCWNEEYNCFFDVDMVNGEHIRVETVAALMPMMSGLLTTAQIQTIAKKLEETKFCGRQACTLDLVPSLKADHELFNPELYWRGPIWINVNWFLWKAFCKCDLIQEASVMKEAMISLVSQKGFWEYYSPFTGEGIGANDFSWSAALTIDLLHE